MSAPRCPRCESREVLPCSAPLEASDEVITATHECSRCHTRFRYVPPEAPERPLPIGLEVSP